MKDRSNLALAVAVVAIAIVLAGLLVGGWYVHSRLGRTNRAVLTNMVSVRQQGLMLRLNQLETAVLNVRLIRVMDGSPREEDIQALVNEIEGIRIEAKDDTPIVTQLNQWKRQMLEQLQVLPAASEPEGSVPEPEEAVAPTGP